MNEEVGNGGLEFPEVIFPYKLASIVGGFEHIFHPK